MKNKKMAAGIAGLAIVALVGGSLAYFNQTMSASNNFSTKQYGSTLTEDFTPEEGKDWEPGVEVNKDVEVVNTGDMPVVVRVKLEEKWTRAGEDTAYKTNDAVVTTAAVSQVDPEDGLTPAQDGTVVAKNLITTGWTKADDGWYYFNTQLEAAASTQKFLDSVTLAADTDMGKYTVTKYYTELEDIKAAEAAGVTGDAATGWKEYTDPMPMTALHNKTVTAADPDAVGYSGSNYSLTITAQTCQATDKAVNAFFGKDVDGVTPVTIPADVLAGWNLQAEDIQ